MQQLSVAVLIDTLPCPGPFSHVVSVYKLKTNKDVHLLMHTVVYIKV